MKHPFLYEVKSLFLLKNLYLLIIPFVIFYLEIMLKITSGIQFSFSGFLGMFFGSLALGLLFDIFCSISENIRLNKWISFVFQEILTLVYLVEYFLNNSFNSFMGISAIFKGTGDIVGNFGDVFGDIVKNGIWIIILFELPAIAYLVLGIFTKVLKVRYHKRTSYAMTSVAAVLGVSLLVSLICFFANPIIKTKLTDQYTFDSAIRQSSFQTALASDLIYLISGGSQARSRIVLEEETESLTETAEAVTEVQTTEQVIDYGQNVMNIDFESLIASTDDENLKDLHSYVNSLTPSNKNKYTGMFAGKNIILITAEAFSKEVIDEERTPTLYRLANNGIVFEDYYQPYWNGSTATGEMSHMTGLIPVDGIDSYYRAMECNMYFSIGNMTLRAGYNNMAFHNGYSDYYDRDVALPNMGYPVYIAKGSGLEGLEGTWPESDKLMMELTVDSYINDQPFSVYYMTISGHCNYTYEGDYFAQKYKDADFLKGLDCSDLLKGYYSGNQELEYAMEYLISRLEEAQIADDTVIVMTSDHYPYGLTESAAWETDNNYLAELYGYDPVTNPQTDHNACIIWSGSMEKEGSEKIVVSEPTYSIDILPTVLNLMGMEYDSRLLPGRDVLSDTEGLVIWPDYSWLTDKGYYDSETATFTPNEGENVTDDYIERMSTITANKIAYCANVLNYDYFNILFGS